MTRNLAFLLLLLQIGTGPQSAPVVKASIEGNVYRLGTREPLEDVQVLLVVDNKPFEVFDPTRPATVTSALSDSQGHFMFKDIDAGAYRLAFSANGYVRQEYGQRGFPGKGALISLASGQSMTDLTVELTPAGVVSGTIRDEEKRPLGGMPVQLMRAIYDSEGARILRTASPSVLTDDRGEYRIYFVTPGAYLLNAGTPQGPSGFSGPDLGPNESKLMYGNLYFPGVADIKSAAPVEVRSGEQKSGMDFILRRQDGVRVSGRIVDSAAGKLPDNVKVRLAYRDPSTGVDYDLEYLRRGKVTYENGNFEFRNVLPGSFAVTASVEEPRGTGAPSTPAPKRQGYAPVQVAGSDVEGIVVALTPGKSISGRVRIEGGGDVLSGFNSLAYSGIGMRATSNGTRTAIPGLPEPGNFQVNPDGTFRLEGVMPGEYRLTINGLRAQFYVKEARIEGADILTRPFQFTGAEVGTLEIVLSSQVASIEGNITNGRSSAAPGAQVVLVPEQSRHRPELFKNAVTDQNGHYAISNVPPGDYKLYAWESIEPYGWFDPEISERYGQIGKVIRITESSRQVLDARLIPAAQ